MAEPTLFVVALATPALEDVIGEVPVPAVLDTPSHLRGCLVRLDDELLFLTQTAEPLAAPAPGSTTRVALGAGWRLGSMWVTAQVQQPRYVDVEQARRLAVTTDLPPQYGPFDRPDPTLHDPTETPVDDVWLERSGAALIITLTTHPEDRVHSVDQADEPSLVRLRVRRGSTSPAPGGDYFRLDGAVVRAVRLPLQRRLTEAQVEVELRA